MCFIFRIFHLALTAFISKLLKSISGLLNWPAEENLVVNNKDSRVFMSWNYRLIAAAWN